MAIRHLLTAAFLTLLANTAFAQAPAAGAMATGINAQRAWILDQLRGSLNDARSVQATRARLNRMSPRQINQLTHHYQRLLGQAQQQLQQAQNFRSQIQQQPQFNQIPQTFQPYGSYQPYNYGPQVLGYAPVITWLPQGTQFGARAAVSPDRRHVRVNAMPFFSSIPHFDTYNLQSGETRRTFLQPPRR